ncbi:hypothetical protein [Bacillus pinisoli]|uniref:hypothetical protein n=1 Tax=Bacillus pinisoli TaxID=2901866 RepID=UPI001FF5CA10|nr:hypothetical protein [Bacillus pinisoli]
MIINRKQLMREKLQQIMAGYSAYAETKEVALMLKKELLIRNIEVYVDETDKGFWFIPSVKKANA